MPVSADHHLVELRHGGRSGLHLPNHPPIFHDVNAIAEFENLVESMRHENEAGALLEGTDPGKQNIDIALFQDRGWFVQKDDQMSFGALLQGQRFGELDHLAGREAELRSPGARVDVHLHLVELAASRGIQASTIDQSQPGKLGFLPEINVLADGQVQQKRLLLENDPDAIEIGFARASQRGPAPHPVSTIRGPANRRRPEFASASTCRRRSRRPVRPLR